MNYNYVQITFQAILATDGNVSFALFVYENLTELNSMSFPRLIGIDSGDLSHKIYYLYNDELFHPEPKDNSVFFRIDGK